jgi:hypothetical protein
MKLAILSSAPAGGAGIAAYRIYEALKLNTNYQIDFIDISLLGEVPHDVSPTFSGTNNSISNTHFTIDYASDVRDWVIDYLMKYDLINIQWSSYLISTAEILVLAAAGKRILFTLHDYYYFTGGCHYPAGCNGYTNSCVACPQVDESKCSQLAIMDSFSVKKKLFSYPNVHLSAPSNFIVDAALQSGVVTSERAHVIRNAYRPLARTRNYDEKISILLISDSFSEKRKGLLIAVSALNKVASNLEGCRISVHLVGGLDRTVLSLLNIEKLDVITHGHIKEHSKLVDVYKQSNFILTASLEDNWPNILVEGTSYGCVPIVGPGHGCEEFVREFDYGFVSTDYSVEAFSDSITNAISQSLNFHDVNIKSDEVVQVHSYFSVATSYASVFKSIL